MINIGELIAAKRKAKGLKQFELAKLAEIAPAQLCKVENGRINPSFNMVERIAAALDSSIPELIYGEKRKSSTKANVEDAAESESIKKFGYIPIRSHEPDAAKAIKVLKKCADDFVLSSAPNCTLVWKRPYFRFEGAGAALAELLRNDLGLGTAPAGDLASALRYRGVLIEEAKLPKDVGSIALWDMSRKAPTIVLNSSVTAERRLYRLAYELGSVALYASLGVRLDETLEQHRFLTDFTASFLMPGVTVRTCVAATGIAPDEWNINNIRPIKSYFGVSMESFALRLEELGLITPEKRLFLRDWCRAHYKIHPKAMEPKA